MLSATEIAHNLGLLQIPDNILLAIGLTLLATWPVGLLFPPPVPLGLGEGLVRLVERLQALGITHERVLAAYLG